MEPGSLALVDSRVFVTLAQRYGVQTLLSTSKPVGILNPMHSLMACTGCEFTVGRFGQKKYVI